MSKEVSGQYAVMAKRSEEGAEAAMEEFRQGERARRHAMRAQQGQS